jgi:magnesium-transporting ATPase (P-type)
MEKQKITCTDHKQLNISGSIKSVFFDKTGTITNKHLELKFCVEFKAENTFKEFTSEECSQVSEGYQSVLSTCHALCMINRYQWR